MVRCIPPVDRSVAVQPAKSASAKEVYRDVRQIIAYPTALAVVLRRCDIAHQSVQASIAFGRPFCDEACEMANGPKQVKARHSSPIEDLHEHLSCNRLQLPRLRFPRAVLRLGEFCPLLQFEPDLVLELLLGFGRAGLTRVVGSCRFDIRRLFQFRILLISLNRKMITTMWTIDCRRPFWRTGAT